MYVNKFGKSMICESSGSAWLGYPLSDLEGHLNAMVRNFTKRKTFRELLDGYGRKNGLEGYVLLKAHGEEVGGVWKFWDGKKPYTVQRWVDRMDGKFLSILLLVCNQKDSKVASKHSVVIHPRDSINLRQLIRGAPLRVYLPGEGYLDNYCSLGRVIKELS